MESATWLKTDGTSETVRAANGKDFQLPELRKMTGGYIQLVSTARNELMYVNEEGLVNDLPINATASDLIHPK